MTIKRKIYNYLKNNINFSKHKKYSKLLFSYIKKSYIHNLSNKIIQNKIDISKYKYPPPSAFFSEVQINYIKNTTNIILSYNITTYYNRKINIIFGLPNEILIYNINNYINNIISWINICDTFCKTKEKNSIKISIFLSDMKKTLPENKYTILGCNEINSGYTILNSDNSREIVIYRREEWFKVLIHEVIHAFSIFKLSLYDFTFLKEYFKINSKFLLDEAYTETYARIIYCAYNSYNREKNISFELFHKSFVASLEIERLYSIYTMNLILNYMDLTYVDIILKHQSKYRENTNVLMYYIIPAILLFDISDFLKHFNVNIRQKCVLFNKSTPTEIYVDYILKKYINHKFLVLTEKSKFFNRKDILMTIS